MSQLIHKISILFCLCFVFFICSANSNAQPPEKSDAKKFELSPEQKIVAAKHRRFEKSLKQLAEISKKKDPGRTDLLYRALSKNSEQRIALEMERISELLASKSYGDAELSQEELLEKLDELIQILESEKYRDTLAEEIKAVEAILKDLNSVKKQETQNRFSNENGGKLPKVEGDQKKTAENTKKLAKKMDKFQDSKNPNKEKDNSDNKKGENKDGKPADGKPKDGKPKDGKPKDGEPKDGKPKDSAPKDSKPKDGAPKDSKPKDGKPSDGKPSDGKPKDGKPQDGKPSDSKPKDSQKSDSLKKSASGDKKQMPGRKEIEKAIQDMEDAIEELKKKARDKASDKQSEAIANLEKAQAKLEELLRQLREEERILFLADLQARLRKMLAEEYKIERETKQLSKVKESNRNSTHSQRSIRLSRRQSAVSLEAEKALLVLREEGSSVAFPEAVRALNEDMLNVADRLQKILLDDLTLAMEDDIIQSLKEMIDALQQEMDELKESKGKPQQGKSSKQNKKLVEMLSELKLLRSMQGRINNRTKSYSRAIDGDQATDPELIRLLKELARREARVQKAAYDISSGKTK